MMRAEHLKKQEGDLCNTEAGYHGGIGGVAFPTGSPTIRDRPLPDPMSPNESGNILSKEAYQQRKLITGDPLNSMIRLTV